ncbi:hypothetical protein KAU34_10625 [candidate division WOR-3 bacterium]|nr:hypothetical protein [candidate division WOR-3 bacterium]
MDTSREYFEMCEKATEIQENHNVVSGDYFNDGEICEGIYECNNDEGYLIKSIYGKWFLPSECVWLLRQDQLQEMYHIIANDYQGLFKIFGEEIYKTEYDKFKSPEQLWLAFVMYEKFNKVWDGKEWTKKND